MSAVALTASQLALLPSSLGVHPIALSTRRFGSAVLIRSVTAFVLVASALAAVAATAAQLALLPSSIGRSSDRLEHAPLRLRSPHLRRGCFRACGISFGRCCFDGRSGGADFEQHWAFIRSPDACVASASAAVALMAAQAAPPLSSCSVQPIALSMLRFGSAVLTCCVAARVLAASDLSAVAATSATTAATAALLPSSTERSSDRPEHAPLGLNSPHLQRGCFRACGISFGRCCLDGRSGGAAFEQHWRSSDRLEHASLRPQQSAFAAWLLACLWHQL